MVKPTHHALRFLLAGICALSLTVSCNNASETKSTETQKDTTVQAVTTPPPVQPAGSVMQAAPPVATQPAADTLRSSAKAKGLPSAQTRPTVPTDATAH